MNEGELLKKAYEQARLRYSDNAAFKMFQRVVLNGEDIETVAADEGILRQNANKARNQIAALVAEELAALRRKIG